MREAKYLAEQKSKDPKVPDDVQPMELVEEPPMLTPTSSTASSTVYTQPFPHHEIETHQTGPQCHGHLTAFSPQSIASYQSVAGSSPFHDLQMQHPGMVFGHQSSYHPQALDSQDHISATMNATFIPMTRPEAIAPWTHHVPSTSHNYAHHVPNFSDPSGSHHPLHGMAIDEIGFSTQQYHGAPDHDAAVACFATLDQVDPQQLNMEAWKYRGLP